MRSIVTASLFLVAPALTAQTVEPNRRVLEELPRRVLACNEHTPFVAVTVEPLLAESQDGSVSDLGAAHDAAPRSDRVLVANGRSLEWLDCTTRQRTFAYTLEHEVFRVDLQADGTVWAIGHANDSGSRPLTRVAVDGTVRSTVVDRPEWSDWERSRVSEWQITRPSSGRDVGLAATPSGAVLLYLEREVFVHCTEALDCETVSWKSPRGDVCAEYLAQRTEPACPSQTLASAEVWKGRLWLLAYLTGVSDDEDLTMSRRDRILAVDVESGATLETVELPAESLLFVEGSEELTLLQKDGTLIQPLLGSESRQEKP